MFIYNLLFFTAKIYFAPNDHKRVFFRGVFLLKIKNLIFLIFRINCSNNLHTNENCAFLHGRSFTPTCKNIFSKCWSVLIYEMKWKLPAPNDIVFSSWILIQNWILCLCLGDMDACIPHNCDFICNVFHCCSNNVWPPRKSGPSMKVVMAR